MSAGPSQPGAMSQSIPRSQAVPTQNTPARSSFRGSLGGITPHSAGRLRGDLGSVSRLQRSMSYGPSQTVATFTLASPSIQQTIEFYKLSIIIEDMWFNSANHIFNA